MPTSKANAKWEGTLKDGRGNMRIGSGDFEFPFSFDTRFSEKGGANPEELIGAAHAGCFSMAFSHELSEAGYPPKRVETSAEVSLEKVEDGFAITTIQLKMKGDVPGIEEQEFLRIADAAKNGCPVSKALAGTKIELDAKLVS